MILKVGLTGGIGSGKTTISKIFEVIGIPVFYADDVAKDLINSDPDLKNQIIKAFGKESFQGNHYNTKHISEIVFNNYSQLEILNSIIHPYVYVAFNRWFEKQHHVPYVIMEAAILYESGLNKILNYVITVNSPEEVRLRRIIKRDNSTLEKVKSIIDTQLTDSERSNKAEFIIINDDFHLLIPQVLEIHHKFVTLQKK